MAPGPHKARDSSGQGVRISLRGGNFAIENFSYIIAEPPTRGSCGSVPPTPWGSGGLDRTLRVLAMGGGKGGNGLAI